METVENIFQGSFSVVVAGFLLVRMEHQLRLLQEAIERLRHCQTCIISPINQKKEDFSGVAIPENIK